MATLLVAVEFKDGKIKSGSQELLSAAKASGGTVKALAFGPGAKALATAVGDFGVTELYVSEAAGTDQYNPEVLADLAKAAVEKSGATIVLASGSSTGRDLWPRVGAKLESAVASDCVELKFEGDKVTAKKPLYAGKCTADVTFPNSKISIVVMRANQLPIHNPKAGTQPQVIELAAPAASLALIIKEIVKGTSTKLDLTEANVIVSGGRGMKNAENFKLLNDLADVLGATVGASRAVVDDGWVPHTMQVGQTGKTVSPSLYIACGISGMIQHLAGMSSSKVIVAINNNPDAPIFKKATYGIVGDALEVLPLLTAEFKKLLAH